ncbi:unnamed protein product [Peronospora farinosa]|uniref:Uncharacterized protein n=1 Tax=Peronospora farinosa TaxID=134698 RepID=A0AAV0TEA0_9STRA|nr:unnamed protein product [Peronospora farinosa]CAI5718369.1 unnamed protein product [Peronospora farinosa]
MEVTPTLNDVQAFRQLTLANEHVMICLCGVDVKQDVDTRVLQEAVRKIIRIKMQMGGYHQISLAKAQGSRLVIEQEFTRDIDALVAAVPGVLSSVDDDGIVDLDALFDDVLRYFGAQREMECQATSSFRLLLIYRQVKQNPQLHIMHREVPVGFLNEPTCHLDIIYWHQDVPLEIAQSVFDQLCLYDSTNPLVKFYFLDVGGSVERLHQALVLVLSHPTNRLSQNGAEQLLKSWFSSSKRVNPLN